MEKLSRTLCLGQNNSSSNNKSCKKNKEVMISETFEESLKNWKLPPFSASDVYKRSGIFSSSAVKSVEAEIPISEEYTTIPLFSDNLKRAYPKKFEYLHIGMIQVGLKPTKLGSNTSAVIRLHGCSHNLFNIHDSVFGMVESSLCDGPIYFSYFPPSNSHYVSMHTDLSSSLNIDIKAEGSSMMRGDENIILLYRLHYKLRDCERYPGTRNLSRYCVDKEGETTLFLTNVAQSNLVLSKRISWNQVAVPQRWMDWKEYAEAHVLMLDVRGFKKEEVEVDVEPNSILRIIGERSEDQKWIRSTFFRRLRLPDNAKLEQVMATMENEVLTVMVPKEEFNKELEVKAVHIG